MCGIAGLILKTPGLVGQHLVQMLDGCQHRGPDSTGFAMYHADTLEALICRIYLGCAGDSPQAAAYATRVLAIIAEYGGTVLEQTFIREHLRLVLTYAGAVKPLCCRSARSTCTTSP